MLKTDPQCVFFHLGKRRRFSGSAEKLCLLSDEKRTQALANFEALERVLLNL